MDLQTILTNAVKAQRQEKETIKEIIARVNKSLDEEEEVLTRVAEMARNREFWLGECLLVGVILKTDFNEIAKKSGFSKRRFLKLLNKKIQQIKREIKQKRNTTVNKEQLFFYRDVLKEVEKEEKLV